MQKEVSIIIPTYKPGKYLSECLDSLLRQDFDSRRIEIIVVLNGCSEPYLTDITSYIKASGSTAIKLIHTEESGVSNARNIGLSYATGNKVCFIDDDDWVSPNYISQLAGKCDDDFTIVEANVKAYDEITGNISDDYLTRAFEANNVDKQTSLFKARSFLSSSCCKIIPRSIIGERRFDCRFRLGEDSLFMATVSNKIKTIRTTTPDAIYYRRVRPTSASRKGISRKDTFINSLRLSATYIKVFSHYPTQYNLLLFLSRIVATMLKIVKN